MATYSICNAAILPSVIRELRSEGFRAWGEMDNGADVLCTNANPGMIALCAGHGLWATRLYEGLPGGRFDAGAYGLQSNPESQSRGAGRSW
jgi:hypothetical protein